MLHYAPFPHTLPVLSMLPDRAHWRRSGKKRGVPHVFCAHPEWLTARNTCTTPLPALGGPVNSYHNTPCHMTSVLKRTKNNNKEEETQEDSSSHGYLIHAVQRMCVFFLYQYYLNPIARLWRSHSQNPSTYLKSMFMLLLCIYVCKYIYLCVSVYTCFIVQNMYHCALYLSD